MDAIGLFAGELLLRATVVLIGAAATTRWLSAASHRAHMWRAALLLCLALPLVDDAFSAAPTDPRWVAPLSFELPAVTDGQTRPWTDVRPIADTETPALTHDAGAGSTAGDAASTSMLTLFGAAWILGVAILLAEIALGLATAARRRATSRLLATVDVDGAPVEIRRGGDRTPAAIGVIRPFVLLPEASSDWPDDRRRLVIAHELAHVRRGDLVSWTIGRVSAAVLWMHPLAWWGLSRLRDAIEHAADDDVLQSGSRPSDYAAVLLAIATSPRRARRAAEGLAMARGRSSVGARIEAVLRRDADRRPVTRRQRTLTAMIGLGVALSLPAVAYDPIVAPGAVAPADGATLFGDGDRPAGFESDFLQARLTSGDLDVGLFLRGDVDVSPTGDRVVSISDGGVLLIATHDRVTGRLRRLLAAPEPSGSSIDYAVDGERRPLDSAARAWLSDALRTVDSAVRRFARPGRRIQGLEPHATTHDGGSVLLGETTWTIEPERGTRLLRRPAGDGRGSLGAFAGATPDSAPDGPLDPAQVRWMVLLREHDRAPHRAVAEAVRRGDGRLRWSVDGEASGDRRPSWMHDALRELRTPRRPPP